VTKTKKISKSVREKVIHLYKKGATFKEVADFCGISQSSAYRIVKDQEVSIRTSRLPAEERKKILLKKTCRFCGKKFGRRKKGEAYLRFKEREFCTKSCKGKATPATNIKKMIKAAATANRGKPSWNKGKKCPETSKKLKGRKASEVTRRKQSETRRKKFASGEIKAWNKGVQMWKNRQHPRGTLGKKSKLKGRTFEEIHGVEKARELKKRLSDFVSEQRKKGVFKTVSKAEDEFCIALKKIGFKEGLDFIRQNEFTRKDGTRYRVDFAFPREKIVLEFYGSCTMEIRACFNMKAIS